MQGREQATDFGVAGKAGQQVGENGLRLSIFSGGHLPSGLLKLPFSCILASPHGPLTRGA
jgi:hypothetical protein